MLAKLTAYLVGLGPLGVIALAAIDSAGLPVPGGLDALLILLAIKNPSQAYWCAAVAVIGSSLGNIFLFLAARRGGRSFHDRETPIGWSRRFRNWFHRYGLLTVFIPAVVPLPLPMKVFVISAGALGVRLVPFLLVVVVGRVGRYFGEVYLGLRLGDRTGAYLRDHVWELVGVAGALFVCLYLLVKISDRFRVRMAA